MKKKFLSLLLFVGFLTACGNQETNMKPAESNSEKIAASSKKKEKIDSSLNKVADVEKTGVYQYETEEAGRKQIINETIIYKGDEFIKIGLHITHKATEEEKSRFAGGDFEIIQAELLSYLEQQTTIQQLKEIPGVFVGTAVTTEFDIVVDIHIDMKTVDVQALSSIEGMGVDFTQLAELTPTQYILGLKLHGATTITQ